MRRSVVAVATACALAGTTLSATGTATAHPIGSVSPARTTLTFIEALAAIPDASRALASARTELQDARERRASVMATAIAADAQLSRANADAKEARYAQTRAEMAARSAQAAIDDAVRVMYLSGGTVPSLPEVMLTADSELGLARSLFTRQYLAKAGTAVVQLRDRSQQALAQTTASTHRVESRRSAAAAGAVLAEQAVVAADRRFRTEEARVADARDRYRELMRITSVDRSAEYPRIKKCGDWLTRLLSRNGFAGEDLREAWAIVMRESGGRADAVSATQDLGLFQINTATWRRQPWFDRKALLTRVYNVKIAHQLSRGGASWYSWGLDGHGRPDPGAYVRSGWSSDRIMSAIVLPYIQWYAQYPCRPPGEKDLGLGIAPPRADEGKPVLQEGAGQVAGVPVGQEREATR